MRAHTITTKARAGGERTHEAHDRSRGILALSLAVVLLAATASTASAHRLVYDVPRDAPRHAAGELRLRRSAGRNDEPGAALYVWGLVPAHRSAARDTLNPSISVSGDYAQTNDCPPTLSDRWAAQSCTINVTFTPTGTGPKTGTLSTGAGRRRAPTATLTGNGVTTRLRRPCR